MDKIVNSFFQFNKDENKSVCQVEGCTSKLSGQRTNNLKRHLTQIHKKDLSLEEKVANKQRKIENSPNDSKKIPFVKIPVNCEIAIKACVRMVTTEGRPLCSMEDRGFRELVEPTFNAIGITINRHNIIEHIKKYAEELREVITKEVKGKLFCLKIDSAKRLDRNILGINVQFIKDDKIVIRNIAIKVMEERVTGVNICDIIKECLIKYNINLNQIYCLTSDNGANMLLSAKLLAEIGNDILSQIFPEDEESLDDEANCVCESAENMDIIEIANILKDFSKDKFLLSIRCAAHTLQLGIHDFVKEKTIHEIISRGREVIKQLKSTQVLRLIKQEKAIKPKLDNDTRWNSTYMMLKSLIDLELFINKFKHLFPKIELSGEDWLEIKLLVNILDLPYFTTMQLQKEEFTLTDFYIEWIKLKQDIKNIKNKYSETFIKILEIRIEKLLNNDAMLCAMYLDPRCQSSVAKSKKERIKKKLLLIHLYNKRIFDDSSESGNFSYSDLSKSLSQDKEIYSQEDTDILKIVTMSSPVELSPHNYYDVVEKNFAEEEKNQEIIKIIEDFDNIQRIHPNESVLKYWATHKNIKNELYQLANIIFSVPATQVSVERCFSAVKLILSNKRYNLGHSTLEDIILLKFNVW